MSAVSAGGGHTLQVTGELRVVAVIALGRERSPGLRQTLVAVGMGLPMSPANPRREALG